MAGYSLGLFDNVNNSNAWLADLTPRFPDWRRSIRDIGGCWYGEGTYRGTTAEMRNFFLTSLFGRVLESEGGVQTWEGFIAEMELTHKGLSFIRSAYPMANYSRVIYRYIGSNLFTDGSAESSTWVQVGTPSTHEFTTAWFTRGTQSVHVVTDAASEGTQIQNNITITSGRSYICRVTAQIVSGNWTLAVRNTADDAVLGQRAATTTDENEVLTAQLPDTHTATNVYVNLTADGAGAEAYFDAAVLQLSPFRKETEWFTDTDSEGEYGRIERVLIEAGLTDAQAEGLARDVIYRSAWPRTRPPERFGVAESGGTLEDGLTVSVAGYVHTLGWKHAVATGGNDSASKHVKSLVTESEFITVGRVEDNLSFTTLVKEDNPITLWDGLEEIILAGDGTGTPYAGGVYPGRVFDYGPRSTSVDYTFSGGQVRSAQGGAIKPWRVRPGICRMADMPVGSSGITGVEQDDPRNVWVSEVEFVAPNGIEFTREERMDEI
jgi:hypothetical protein